jgi:hypothetical protein
LKTALSAPSFSTELSRIPSSCVTTPASVVTGAIWASNRSSSRAAAAFSCEATEYSPSWVREKPQR